MAEGDRVSGRYRMEELIGRGGMGEVWRARDELLDRTVAVKFARLTDTRAARLLKNEARNAGRLHHPHIVGVFDFVEAEDDTTCWIVMEYVPARSLAQIMAERGPLGPDEAGAIGCQIADALTLSHAKGVVHGDVTPGNVLVTRDGVAKLTDFGISRALWSDPTFDGNATGGVRGTPRYLPPEVAVGRRSDRMSDMFSLGATLYAAVEGHSPYGEAEYPMAYIDRARNGAVEPPGTEGPLTETLTALLQFEPRRRPTAATARAMLSAAVDLPQPAGSRSHDGHTRHGTPFTLRLRAPAGRSTLRLLPGSGRGRRAAALTAAGTAVAAALVAGIVVWAPWGSDGGEPAARAGTEPADSKNAAVMGDPRKADPCGLLDTATFTRFGESEIDTDYGEFDRCDVLIQKGHDGETVADVEVNFASEPGETDSQTKATKVGRVTVVSPPPGDGECERNLRLPDGNQIWISAEEEASSAPDLCAVADAAADHALKVLARGPVPRRPAPFPAASLANLNACDLLDDPTLAVLPGTESADADPHFADWGCEWDSRSSHAGIVLVFNRDNSLKGDGEPKRLGGRQAYIAPEAEGDHTCSVMTVNRTYTDTAGEDTVEHVSLMVFGPQATDKLCDTAKTLSTAVAKKLPGS